MKAVPWIVAAVAVAALAYNLGGTEPETVAADYSNNVNYDRPTATTEVSWESLELDASIIVDMIPQADIDTMCDAFNEVVQSTSYDTAYRLGYGYFAEDYVVQMGIPARDVYAEAVARC